MNLKVLTVLASIFWSTYFFSQDTITGIYNILGLRDHELVFNIDSTVTLVDSQMNYGATINGLWHRLNDSTVHVQLDTIYSYMGSEFKFSEFRCIQLKDPEIIWCYFYSVDDSTEVKCWYRKHAEFHKTGSIKSERVYSRNGSIITQYFENGMVSQVTEYNEDRIQHGIYLKYGMNGRLITIQHWKKGKKISEAKY